MAKCSCCLAVPEGIDGYTRDEMRIWNTGKYAFWMRVYNDKLPLPEYLFHRASTVNDTKSMTWLKQHNYHLEYAELDKIVYENLYDGLVWLGKNGYLAENDVLGLAMTYNKQKIANWCLRHTIQKNSFYYAAGTGKIQLLQQLINNGETKDIDTCCQIAAYFGQTEALEFLCNNRFMIDINVCINAAKTKNFKCLEIAHSYGASLSEEVCVAAVEGDSLKCLKYIIDNGCSYTMNIAHTAAIWNRVRILKWICKNKLPWDISISEEIVSHSENDDILKWLVLADYPYKCSSIKRHVERNRELKKWFEENCYNFED